MQKIALLIALLINACALPSGGGQGPNPIDASEPLDASESLDASTPDSSTPDASPRLPSGSTCSVDYVALGVCHGPGSDPLPELGGVQPVPISCCQVPGSTTDFPNYVIDPAGNMYLLTDWGGCYWQQQRSTVCASGWCTGLVCS